MSWPQDVRKKDLRIDYYRGSGAGGQHRNKTSSACRITHLPTGITAQCEDERRQGQNRSRAFERLAAKLTPLMKSKTAKTINKKVIRTYHEPRNTVKDYRAKPTFNFRLVLEGKDLEKIWMEISK